MFDEGVDPTNPTQNYKLIMDPRTARYIMDYLYFSRDVEPVWYYKKVSPKCIYTFGKLILFLVKLMIAIIAK